MMASSSASSNVLAHRRRQILISFSGMDGSGKSTQIEMLCQALHASGFSVKRIEFWNHVVAFSRMRAGFSHRVLQSDGRVGSPEQPANRNDKNARSWYLVIGRFILYFCDTLKLRSAVAQASAGDADVIIFDRYLYDQLATLPLPLSATRLYVRFLLKLAPKPDIAFLLDAVPEVARARKPEYPLDFMHKYRACYLLLSKMAQITVVPPSDVEEAQTVITRRVSEYLKPVKGTGDALVLGANSAENLK